LGNSGMHLVMLCIIMHYHHCLEWRWLLQLGR